MAEEPKEQNTTLTLEGFWKLLDNKLVSLGTPAALVAVALDFARKSQWREAGFCVVGAIGLWILIQVANKLAPKIDKLLDWILNNAEILLLNGWAKLTSDFEGKYYERLKFDCREYEIRGINRESLELKNLFVPLKMAQKSAGEMSQNLIQFHNASLDPLKQQEIGQLLVFMTGEIKQRLVILGAPGSGKSTLLRHITLMYATRRQRRLHRQVPKLIPVFLQLRYIYQDIIDNQDSESSLVKVIEKAVQKLQPSDPLKPRDRWFARRLRQGKCLIMLDGLDEIADDLQRQQVSQWVSKQITEYSNTPFIITSRPEAYKKAPLQGNVLELEVQPFSREQRNKFIQDWYLCLKKKNQKVDLGIKDKAIQAANDLIAQIDASSSLKLMARNPLLLNMIVITHNWNVTLSTRRVDLYEEMCRVLLEGRQRAKGLSTPIKANQKKAVLSSLALELMQQNIQAFTLDESSGRDKTFKQARLWIQNKLEKIPNQTLSPEEFITKDDWGVRELLSEREQEGIYEFAHKTFQEYLAAVEIEKLKQENILVEALNDDKKLAWWRETIRFYAAQTDATKIIDFALKQATIPMLTLAYQLSQEAKEISKDVQDQLKAKFEKALESDNVDEFTLAAKVKLADHLHNLNSDLLEDPSNSEVETIDNSYVTWAEYQLFLNETTNSHYTPANKRQVQESITNISFWDANRFCAWLSLRSRQELGEPGICYRPASKQEDQQNNDGKIKLVRFQVPALYARLAYYLAAGMWREADEETDRLMLQVAGREEQGYLEPEDIRQFPCEDLRTIDKLWVKYSDGRFGFSVQKEIYLSVGGILEGNQTRSPIVNKIFVRFKLIYARWGGRVGYNKKFKLLEAWERFCDRVEWGRGEYISRGEVKSYIASMGHFPKINSPRTDNIILPLDVSTFSSLASRLVNCNI